MKPVARFDSESCISIAMSEKMQLIQFIQFYNLYNLM